MTATASTIETGNLEIKAEVSIDDTGTVTGIAWPFGQPDSYGDLIEPSAFSFAPRVPMIVEHEQKSVVGVWESYSVTDKGLEVKGRLFVEGIEPARQARLALQRGSMSGLSIGYRLHEAKSRPGGRVLTALTINEISLCKRPVHPDARITETKSLPLNVEMENSKMENAEQNKPVASADPVVSADEIKALKDEIATMQAKLNRRPAADNNNHPKASNDNGNEVKAFTDFVRTGDASEVKALSYGGSSGGTLAPETVAATILEKVAEYSPVRGLAQTIAMSGPLLQLPRLVDEVTPAPRAETATAAEDEPSFEQIDLKAFEMAVTVPVTRILLEDAQIDLAAYLSNHIARRFGQTEAAWFVNGNGTTQAEGVLHSDDVEEIETSASGFAALGAENLIDLYYHIKTNYSVNGSWLMNRKTMSLVRKLKDSDGSYIWQPGITAGQPSLLLGRPVYEAVDAPDVEAGKTPIIFGDFASGYAIADRVGFDIIRDDITGAGNGIVKLHARRRVGGRVIMGEALAKLKISA